MIVVQAIILGSVIVWVLICVFWFFFIELPQTVMDVRKQNKGMCPCGAKLGPWLEIKGVTQAYGQAKEAVCANGHVARSGDRHMTEWGDF